MIKKLACFLFIFLTLAKILACILGFLINKNISNYSITYILDIWNNLDSLNLFTQIYAYILFILFGLIGYRALMFIFTRNINQKIIEDLHGSAGFLSFNHVKETNLINNKGVFVGGIEDTKGNLHYLRNNGSEHCLILAPTRAGKGVCLVIPTLLTWEHSCIVYDIKRELYHVTAKWRGSKSGADNNIYKFDSAEIDTHCFNPMNEIRINTEHQISDAQNMAYMLVDTDGKGIEGNHWLESAFTLFTGCILYVAHKNYQNNQTKGSIPKILALLCDDASIEETLKLLAEFKCSDTFASKAINQVGFEMLKKEIKELSGIVSSTLTKLSLYRDPLVANCVNKSDFTIDDICNGLKPATLYIVADPNNKDRYRPLIRLILNMILRKLTAKMIFENGQGKSPNKHRLLLLLDEFPSLGNIPILEDSLAFMAGYGIKAMLIAQDLNQIYAKYNKTESIIANCHIITAFTPNNPDTAQWLCRKLGDTTIIKESTSISGKRKDIMLSNTSTSYNEVRRNLMTPEEIMTMPSLKFDMQGKLTNTGNMLIFINGQKPILGRQMPFFIDDDFGKLI